MKIRAYTGYDERHKIRYYEDFEIISIEELKELGKTYYFSDVPLDPEQGNNEVYDYDYYAYKDEDKIKYIAVLKFDFDKAVYNHIKEQSIYLNYNYQINNFDYEDAMSNLYYNPDYFKSNEWLEICEELSDRDLDNFFTEYGKNNKEYNRNAALEELECIVDFYVEKNKAAAREEEQDYYSF